MKMVELHAMEPHPKPKPIQTCHGTAPLFQSFSWFQIQDSGIPTWAVVLIALLLVAILLLVVVVFIFLRKR